MDAGYRDTETGQCIICLLDGADYNVDIENLFEKLVIGGSRTYSGHRNTRITARQTLPGFLLH
jgi:hypothetical protein